MRRLLAFLTLVLLSSAAFSATRVVYLNGINVDDNGRVLAISTIWNLLNGPSSGARFVDATFLTLPNPDNGFWPDVDELVRQAQYSGQALTEAKAVELAATAQSPRYRYYLGRLYLEEYRRKIEIGFTATDPERRILRFTKRLRDYLYDATVRDGDDVILIAHSQGNFFAEAAYAYLHFELGDSGMALVNRHLRIVGVAALSASSPNGRYLAAVEDQALLGQKLRTLAIPNYALLARNVAFCPEPATASCLGGLSTRGLDIHGFAAVYASDLLDLRTGRAVRDLLVDQIVASFDELLARGSAPPPTVNSASCTAPIVGQAMTCTVTGTNLPAAVSFTASNCNPSPMTVVAGGSTDRRQFTCAPVTAGELVQVSYVVPEFIGPLPQVVAAVATLPPPPPTTGPVTFVATARIFSITGSPSTFPTLLPAGVSVGDLLTYEYTFNPAAVDRAPSDPFLGEYPLDSMKVSVGANPALTRSDPTFSSITVSLPRPGWDAGYSAGSFSHQTCTNCTVMLVSLNLRNPAPTNWTSEALPVTPPALDLFPTGFPNRNVSFALSQYSGAGAKQEFSVQAEVESLLLKPIPAPAYTPTLTISPPIVPMGGSATLSWDTGGAPVAACTMTQTSGPLSLTGVTGSVTITNIQGQIRFTLTCGSNSTSKIVEIIPSSGGS